MKPLPLDTKLEDLHNHKSRAYRQISKLLLTGGEFTTKELTKQIEMSEAAVWVVIKALRELGLVHICNWIKPENSPRATIPVHKAGSDPDAPRPPAKDATQKERSKKFRQEKQQRLLEEQNKYSWQGIAEALVPVRTVQEQHEVNRLYLNWISEGIYG